jgi:hypothetical protein
MALMAVAMVVPTATGWYVHVNSFPPLHAEWAPRVGVGTVPSIALALLASRYAVELSDRLSWRRLRAAAVAAGLAWMLSLAFVDGAHGIDQILQTPYEYLRTARGVADVHQLLQEYVSRIASPTGRWPVHVAGHPPGAVLFFVGLDRIGLGGGFAAGVVVTVLAATTAVSVLVTVRILGGEAMARRAVPFLVFGPAAVWQAVSADAMFAAVAACGLASLALAASRRSVVGASVGGLLLGCCVMLSYGLLLLGILALTVLVLGRSWCPLPIAAVAALAVVAVFAVLGFSYLDALPALHERYLAGVGGRRQAAYWTWGGLAALAFSAGPLAGAGVAQLLSHVRSYIRDESTRAIAALAAAGAASVLVADATQLSKAEVERIWLPFVPWILLSCALLPERWRRRGIVLQLAVALVVEHLLHTGW